MKKPQGGPCIFKGPIIIVGDGTPIQGKKGCTCLFQRGGWPNKKLRTRGRRTKTCSLVIKKEKRRSELPEGRKG